MQPDAISEPSVFGVRIRAQRFDDAVASLLAWAHEPTARFVCLCPVSTIMQCRDDAVLRQQVDTAAMRTADGMPVVWIQRAMGYTTAERVYGPDLLLALCERSTGGSVRHYFLGGAPGVADRLAERLRAAFPGLAIAGTAAPLVDAADLQPDSALIAALRSTHPSIVWVGLGSPKQERWMAIHSPLLPCLLIGVGAAFDFLSGAKPQAPSWMRRRGLEWLFRLVHEPRRLARRYLIYNTRFVVLVVGWMMARMRRVKGSRLP